MSFSAIDGYAIVADLRVGSNGHAPGVPELALGTGPEDQVTGRLRWDPNLSDGFDSGWVRMELLVDGGTGLSSIVFSVNDVTLTYEGPHMDDILGFILRGGVSGADAAVSFQNVSAQFFVDDTDTTPVQTVYLDDSSATTIPGNETEAENIVMAAPEGSGFEKARLFADVRIQADYLPNPTDLFAQFFVFSG